MITGAGWVSAGPGYRHYFSDDRIMLDASAAISWHLYKMAQARFELPTLANDHLIVGAQAMWQDATQVNYYGIGPDSLEENQSQYRLQTTDFVAYVTVTPNYWLSITGELGWLMRPKCSRRGARFGPNVPDDAPSGSQRSGRESEHSTEFRTWRGRDRRRHPRSSRLSHQRRPLPRGIDLLFRPERRDLLLP